MQLPTHPVQVKCPGCNKTFVANQYAPHPQPQRQVRLSTVEKVLNIEYQSTKSYASYLWIMAIIAGIGVDALAGIFILLTSGKSFIASVGTVLGVHLIALPIIRVMLELVVNVERIAKR